MTVTSGDAERPRDGASMTTADGGGSRLEMHGDVLLDATVDSCGWADVDCTEFTVARRLHSL